MNGVYNLWWIQIQVIKVEFWKFWKRWKISACLLHLTSAWWIGLFTTLVQYPFVCLAVKEDTNVFTNVGRSLVINISHYLFTAFTGFGYHDYCCSLFNILLLKKTRVFANVGRGIACNCHWPKNCSDRSVVRRSGRRFCR